MPAFATALVVMPFMLISQINSVFTSKEAGYIVIFLLLFALLFILLSIYSKAIRIDFNSQGILVKRFLGLFPSVSYDYNKLDGFYTSKVNSKLGTFNELHIMSGKKKIAKLTDFYHSNYISLLSETEKHIENLGYINSGLFSEIKDLIRIN